MTESAPDPHLRLRGGRLELVRMLGRGGGGYVFVARDHDAGEERAVKLATTHRNVQRFLAEAEFLATVDHPRIVKVYEHGQEQGWAWYAMRLYPTTVATRIRRRPPTEELALEWMIQTLEGLAVLHRAGLVHRDVKPGNLFLQDGRSVVVGDLGAARLPIGSVNWQTQTGSYLGSLSYAAPEQTTDAKRVDRRADIFAVGATLYRLLARRRPPLHFAFEQNPAILEPIQEHLRPVLVRACATSPEDRHPTARALAEDLAAAIDRIRVARGEAPEEAARLEAFDATAPPESWLAMTWQKLLERLDGR